VLWFKWSTLFFGFFEKGLGGSPEVAGGPARQQKIAGAWF
jgi:hypothetical protein